MTDHLRNEQKAVQPDRDAIEARRREEAQRRERMQSEICYKGYAYNVRSQFGVDSLRRAIEEDGNG